MKIAVLSDIHGNLHGLEAVLADLERQKPDVIVCAGDMTGCHFPGSLQVLERLRKAGGPHGNGQPGRVFHCLS